jgi:uncharacterized membrane protein YkoI
MNKYRYSIAMLIMVLLSAWSITAQDTTTQRLSLLQALGIVQTGDPNLSGTRFIVDGSYDDDDACWKFEYSDTSEICISDTTGELVDIDDNSGVPAPAATEDVSNGGVPAPATTEDVNSGNVPAPAATEDADIFLVQPTISLDDAIATALRIFPNRIISDFELERNAAGVVIWEIKLDNNTVQVEVDAETGFVLNFGRNSNSNNDDNSGSSDRDDDDNSGSGSNNSGSSDSDDDGDSSGRGRGRGRSGSGGDGDSD